MGGTALKVAIAGFFVWLAAQMGTFVDEILTRVTESVQASELLQIDQYVYYASAVEKQYPRAPKDQAEFETIVREWTSAPAGRDVTKDRWDRAYAYDRVPTKDPRDIQWRIASGGPDRRVGTEDDIVVERDNEHARINRDPAQLVELAVERKERLDRETAARVRGILELAKQPAGAAPASTPSDVAPERQSRELEDATKELAKLVGES